MRIVADVSSPIGLMNILPRERGADGFANEDTGFPFVAALDDVQWDAGNRKPGFVGHGSPPCERDD